MLRMRPHTHNQRHGRALLTAGRVRQRRRSCGRSAGSVDMNKSGAQPMQQHLLPLLLLLLW
jgi:hypothetical protein